MNNSAVDLLLLSGLCNINDFFGVRSETTMSSRMLGPSKIAEQARQGGYTAQVIDFVQFIPDDALYNILDHFIGDNTVVGISVTHLCYIENDEPKEVILKIKKLLDRYRCRNKIKILLGGYGADAWTNEFIADYTIVGKAENEIVPVLDKIFNHGLQKQKMSLWEIKTCNHKWHRTDQIVHGETLPLEIGRGCIFHCKFCKFEYLGKRPGSYVRSMDLIYDELMHNYNHYGVTSYNIVDDTFNDDIEKLKQWHDMIMSLPFKIEYSCYLRADLLHKHKHSPNLLVESGLKACAIGIETFDPTAAKAIGKPWSAKHAKTFLPWLKENTFKDVTIGINFIVGLPGESLDSVSETFAWAKQQKFSCKFFPLYLDKNLIERSRKNKNVIASVFDQQWEKFGYRFVDNYTMWENEHMNFQQANKLTYKYNNRLGKLEPVSSWDRTGLKTLGYSDEYLAVTPRLQIINSKDFTQRRKKFINNYVDKFVTLTKK